MQIALASGSYDGYVRFWRVVEQKCCGQVDLETPVCGLSVSGNKQFLAAAGFNVLKVVRVDNQVQQAQFKPDGECCFSAVEFSANGEYIVATSEDNCFQAYDTRQLQRCYHYKGRAAVNCVSQLGQNYFITGDQSGQLLIFDIRGQEKPVHTIQAFDLGVGVRSVSVQGNRIACADSRGIVQLYSTAQGGSDCPQLRTSIQGHQEQIHKIKLSPDGVRMVTAGIDRCCKLWSIGAGWEVEKTAQFVVDASCLDLAYNSNGQFLLLGADKCPRLFNSTQGQFEPLKQYGGHPRFVTAVALAD